MTRERRWRSQRSRGNSLPQGQPQQWKHDRLNFLLADCVFGGLANSMQVDFCGILKRKG